MLKLKPLLAAKSHVIWDWNGTLLNDVEVCVEIVGGLLAKHTKHTFDRSIYRQNFRFPIADYYQAIGFSDSVLSFADLTKEFVTAYQAALPRCVLHENTEELLRYLGDAGISQYILSAAHQADLDKLMKHFDIQRYFAAVHGLNDHYAASKLERGKELLKIIDSPKKSIILVGDTDHDAKVANELGIECLILGDGHQDYQRLAHLPQVIADRYC